MSILVEGFFSLEKINLELNSLDLKANEKEKIIKMAQELAELRLLDLVLEKLEERDKELFMEQLHGGSVELAAEFLREKIANVEELLRERALLLEAEILEDVRSLKDDSR
jgi:hypothetical protein